jgi:hypothetical protein
MPIAMDERRWSCIRREVDQPKSGRVEKGKGTGGVWVILHATVYVTASWCFRIQVKDFQVEDSDCQGLSHSPKHGSLSFSFSFSPFSFSPFSDLVTWCPLIETSHAEDGL